MIRLKNPYIRERNNLILKTGAWLDNGDGFFTAIDIRYASAAAGKLPAVIVSHGFKGYKDWGFFPYIAEKIAEKGAITLCQDFSLNGIADPAKGLYDPSVFARNTVSRELSESKNMIAFLKESGSADWHDYWSGEIYLLGHSLGGAVSLIAASEDSTVKGAILWASIANMDRNTERQKEEWKRKGVLEFTVGITGQVLRLDYSYQQDKDDNKERFDLTKAAANTACPILIVHGKQDVTVRPSEAEKLHAVAGEGKSRLVLVEKCNHIFNIGHPMIKTSVQLEEALEESVGFIFS